MKASPDFVVGDYTVRRLSPRGLWLVTADSDFELGSLFWRAQEMYESPNPAFRAKPPALSEYIKWYCEHVNSERAFSYYTDYEGYNLSSAAIDTAQSFSYPDTSRYDVLFAHITGRIRGIQGGDYYLIGARTGDKAVLDHELAHGMFHLLPKYREAATKLVEALPAREEVYTLLRKEGYWENVLVDEAQAYLATGIFAEMGHLEPVRHPFMKLFAVHRKRLIKGV